MTKEIPKWLQGTVVRIEQKAAVVEAAGIAGSEAEKSVIREQIKPLLGEVMFCFGKWRSLEVDRIFKEVASNIFHDHQYSGLRIYVGSGAEDDHIYPLSDGRDLEQPIAEIGNELSETLIWLIRFRKNAKEDFRYKKQRFPQGASVEAVISHEEKYDDDEGYERYITVEDCRIHMDKKSISFEGVSVSLEQLQSPRDLESVVAKILTGD